jgi:hypothetical protein
MREKMTGVLLILLGAVMPAALIWADWPDADILAQRAPLLGMGVCLLLFGFARLCGLGKAKEGQDRRPPGFEEDASSF